MSETESEAGLEIVEKEQDHGIRDMTNPKNPKMTLDSMPEWSKGLDSRKERRCNLSSLKV